MVAEIRGQNPSHFYLTFLEMRVEPNGEKVSCEKSLLKANVEKLKLSNLFSCPSRLALTIAQGLKEFYSSLK